MLWSQATRTTVSLPALPPNFHDLVAWAMGTLRSEIGRAVQEAVADELPGAIRTATRPEYLTRKEAADYLGRCVRSVDTLRSSRQLGWSKRGGRVMIAIDDLDAYLEAGKVNARGKR